MDFGTMMRDAALGYSRVPAMDRDRTEARMSASTGEVMWERMMYRWLDLDVLLWDESKMENSTLFGLRIRRDDSVPYGEVQYWTRR